MIRSDREDYTEQIDRLRAARLALAESLDALAAEAKRAARAFRTARGDADLSHLFGDVDAVRRAEEEKDTRTGDLATARGEDA